jgi:hypothetical protein
MKNTPLHYATVFEAQLTYLPTHKYDSLNKYDLTPNEILNMLQTTKIPLEQIFTELTLTTQVYFCQTTNQDFTSNSLLEEPNKTTVLFSTEPITLNTLKERIKNKPEFKDYKILNKRTYGKYQSRTPWHIYHINNNNKEIILERCPDTVIINPQTFEQVQPALPKNQGNISPVFEQFCQPIQLEAIPQKLLNAYLGKCRDL